MKRILIFFYFITLSTSLSGCASLKFLPSPNFLPLLDSQPQSISQMLIVNTNDSHKAELITFERNDNGRWNKKYSFPAVIGRNGVVASYEKKEGDGATPAGEIYAINRAFGYNEFALTGLSYKRVTANDIWIDDPKSPLYNQMTTLPTDAKSYEKLRRDDDLYKNFIVIEYNTNPVVAGKGSAIFLHVWRNKNHPTSGCVAISQNNMNKILSWLKHESSPHIFINYFCGC